MILVDGIPASTIHASDRGLLYGDGLFETLAFADNDFRLWPRHAERLRHGCERLGFPPIDAGLLRHEAEMAAVAMAETGGPAVVRITLTRGSGGSGYQPPPDPQIKRIVQARPWPRWPADHWEQGVRVAASPVRLAVGSPLAGLKHLNRLEQVLARVQWPHPDAVEALMLDHEGYVVEGTMTNLFILEGKRLVTPPVDRCGVAGVMRGLVKELAPRLGLESAETRLRLPRLLHADAAFLTNAVIGLWPVQAIGEQPLAVSPAVRDIQDALYKQLGLRPWESAPVS